MLPTQVSSCAGAADESDCAYQGEPNGACFDGVCLPRGCGNAEVEDGEVCDDGNRLHGDGCSADCSSNETCGNGVVDIPQGESCDDGNNVDGDGCQSNCASPSCGDGVVDAQFNEECDCGADSANLPLACITANGDVPDACCRSCQESRCGDGITDPNVGPGARSQREPCMRMCGEYSLRCGEVERRKNSALQ